MYLYESSVGPPMDAIPGINHCSHKCCHVSICSSCSHSWDHYTVTVTLPVFTCTALLGRWVWRAVRVLCSPPSVQWQRGKDNIDEVLLVTMAASQFRGAGGHVKRRLYWLIDPPILIGLNACQFLSPVYLSCAHIIQWFNSPQSDRPWFVFCHAACTYTSYAALSCILDIVDSGIEAQKLPI